ncbi:hypothetical protein GKE82_23610 [Conexibacter sp. W3-3-2]|uniref:PD-(D/E)XK nuclease family protein n=1 Tax=Conexibacter sp. W3-3-2 TaxID=2675227 RepID=UPI0012B7F23E|nr:PD-(D/E)XK nuclease family protein [Conexibacter sp. W3-3-2]MTD47193.1 hypothetical protein [Conexibacter sp. W3-3-2]
MDLAARADKQAQDAHAFTDDALWAASDDPGVDRDRAKQLKALNRDEHDRIIRLPAEVADLLSPSDRLAQLLDRLPERLPVRLNGMRNMHLSPSAAAAFQACPWKWQTRYLHGVKSPSGAAAVVGSCVETPVEWWLSQINDDTAPDPSDEHVLRALVASALLTFQRKAAAEAIEFGHETPQEILAQIDACTRGWFAAHAERFERYRGTGLLELQSNFSFRLAAHTDWYVLGKADIYARGGQDRDGTAVGPVLWDTKIKARMLSKSSAAKEFQPVAYGLGAAIQNPDSPLPSFEFLQVRRPHTDAGGRTVSLGASRVPVNVTREQLRAGLERFATVAVQIDTLYRTLGPDLPWGYAASDHTLCDRRYCPVWDHCPQGGRP